MSTKTKKEEFVEFIEYYNGQFNSDITELEQLSIPALAYATQPFQIFKLSDTNGSFKELRCSLYAEEYNNDEIIDVICEVMGEVNRKAGYYCGMVDKIFNAVFRDDLLENICGAGREDDEFVGFTLNKIGHGAYSVEYRLKIFGTRYQVAILKEMFEKATQGTNIQFFDKE